MSTGIDVVNKPYINPVKEEPIDDQRNDSGVTSGSSECPSVSPSSIRSSSPTYQFRPNNQYAAWSPSSGNQTLEPQSMDLTPKNDANKFDIESIRHPQLNSHGKVKTYKCKTCAFKSYTKEEHWKHIKIHIDKNKMLTCRACPFATHLKHHYEFHILSYHSGTKPFKCDHCDYACVNKSMLNSHLKSHSNIYPYRCGTCSYATKYLHTLKMHLQKTKHQQGTILNPDGTPNPYPIDVYGTRRGPKLKRQNSSPSSPLQGNRGTPPLDKPAPFEPPQGMHPFNPMLNQNQMIPFHLMPQTMYPGHVMAAHEMVMNLINRFTSNVAQSEQRPRSPDSQTGIESNGVLDLSSRSTKSSENGDDDDMTMAFDNVEVVHHMGDNNNAMKKENDSDSDDNVDVKEPAIFTCQHCSIDFKGESAEIMYRIHMGHHGFCKPYTCNICGEECGNVVQFTMHISKSAH